MRATTLLAISVLFGAVSCDKGPPPKPPMATPLAAPSNPGAPQILPGATQSGRAPTPPATATPSNPPTTPPPANPPTPPPTTPPSGGTPPIAAPAAETKQWREVWPNGKLKAICPMVKDPTTGRWVKHGKWESWQEDGSKAKEGQFVYDKMDGEWKNWFPGVESPYVEVWVMGVKKPH